LEQRVICAGGPSDCGGGETTMRNEQIEYLGGGSHGKMVGTRRKPTLRKGRTD